MAHVLKFKFFFFYLDLSLHFDFYYDLNLVRLRANHTVTDNKMSIFARIVAHKCVLMFAEKKKKIVGVSTSLYSVTTRKTQNVQLAKSYPHSTK